MNPACTVVWAVMLIGSAAAFAELPEGGRGIAARYPGDDGIGDDPAVVFVEDFEMQSVGSLDARWHEVQNRFNAGTSQRR